MRIKFTITKPKCDRIHYITEDDVHIVLSRIPNETWQGLKAVHFNDKAWGRRRLGYTGTGSRIYEISICALPPRVSLSTFLGRKYSPHLFGAIRGQQWPRLAVRRFLLYDVLLHEIGHNQIVDPKARSLKRRYAGEKKAQDFADFWRKKLWREQFDHPDVVHNPPTKEELEALVKGLGDK